MIKYSCSNCGYLNYMNECHRGSPYGWVDNTAGRVLYAEWPKIVNFENEWCGEHKLRSK